MFSFFLQEALSLTLALWHHTILFFPFHCCTYPWRLVLLYKVFSYIAMVLSTVKYSIIPQVLMSYSYHFQNSYSKCPTTFSTFLPKYLAWFSNQHIQKLNLLPYPQNTHTHNLLYYHLYVYFQRLVNIMFILTKLLAAFLNPIFPWYFHTKTHYFLPTLFYGHFPFSSLSLTNSEEPPSALTWIAATALLSLLPSTTSLTYSSQRSHHSFKAYFIIMILV